MRTLVVGDMHGAYKALLQCLQRSGFDRESDRLIVLGDVCDGYPQVNCCIDELLDLKHCDLVIGNHDLWALGWALWDDKPDDWLDEGGANTVKSYQGGPMPAAHIEFLKRGRKYIAEDGRIFVHGGFDPDKPIEKQMTEALTWDRSLISDAFNKSKRGLQDPLGPYREIYIGHTPTTIYGSDTPQQYLNVWAMDTGCGWTGCLSMMDIETKEFWQSDLTPKLYPGIRARNRGYV